MIDLMLPVNDVVAPLVRPPGLAYHRHGSPSFRRLPTSDAVKRLQRQRDIRRYAESWLAVRRQGRPTSRPAQARKSSSCTGSANSAPSLPPAIHLTTALARPRPAGKISQTRDPTSNRPSATAMKPRSETLSTVA